MTDASSTVSPTAHYTGYVWARNGLSHPQLETVEGRVMYEALRPMMTVGGLLGRVTLEQYLLARHRAIDMLLERAIEEQRVSQVIEVAAGLSPRGWRFAERYGDGLVYVEADLPGMAARKRRALSAMSSLSKHHRVEVLDVLREDGAGSLSRAAKQLDRDAGLAIVTEGLLGYLPTEDVLAIWARFARTLAGFEAGRYISDIHVGEAQDIQVRAFRVMLSGFVRGRVYLHFDVAGQVVDALIEAGFAGAEVRPAAEIVNEGDDRAGADRAADQRAADQPAPDQPKRRAHILEASTNSALEAAQ